MARPESVALGGFFPTPTELLPCLTSLIRFAPLEYDRHILVDPCAGNAAAIAAIRHHCFADPKHDASIYAIEIEDQRARAQKAHLLPSDLGLHCDAFHVDIRADPGASLLFLNPPYDFDRVHGRLEQRFLERWTSALIPSEGVLVFIVPHYALSASARFLSEHYMDVRAWRFPASHFDAFRQCVVVGRRRLSPVPDNALDRSRIERWAAEPLQMPELLLGNSTPALTINPSSSGLGIEPAPLDLPGLLRGFRPWTSASFTGLGRTVQDLIGPKFPVAQPPRPAHIALALAAAAMGFGRAVYESWTPGA
jgi:Uncharacterised methyltransferase family (DUF6094)